MNCPNCGGEVMPDEVFCGHCGTRLQPAEPLTSTTPVTSTAPRRSLPVVPIVVGVVILAMVCCLCVVLGGLLGVCSVPAFLIETTPTSSRTAITPVATEVAKQGTPAPGFTVVSKSPVPPATKPVPPVSGDVPFRIVSYVQRTDALSSSAVEIMGEVENTSDQAVDTGWYEVLVTLKDKDGNIIPTEKDLTTNLQRPIVQPGQKSCFRYFFKATDYGFDLAQVSQLEPEVRKAPAGHDAYPVELTVSNVKRAGNTITGDITNDTSYSIRSVFILVTLYDADGNVIGVHYGTRVGEEQMKPGGTMGFTYSIISSDVAATKSFDVLVIAYKQ